jgi:DNA-directed RNA polymerase specialized sigma subunit
MRRTVLATTKKKVTRKKVARRKGVQNYLNNARLLEHISLSKEKWEEAKKGINDPDAMPSAAECMTPELVKMLMMLVDRYAQRANWRGYTYIDDMKSEALVSLLNGSLKFKPEVSQNPFGYLTQIVTHSFLTTLEKEKKVRRIRDDILEQNGFSPSNTRQLENEEKMMARYRKMDDIREGIITPEEGEDS